MQNETKESIAVVLIVVTFVLTLLLAIFTVDIMLDTPPADTWLEVLTHVTPIALPFLFGIYLISGQHDEPVSL
jgi:hypothetical protein